MTKSAETTIAELAAANKIEGNLFNVNTLIRMNIVTPNYFMRGQEIFSTSYFFRFSTIGHSND